MGDRTAEPPSGWPLRNVWIGMSVEDQLSADRRIPFLYETPAVVRWLSLEPLIGPVNLANWHLWSGDLKWAVIGGESGPGARPMLHEWATLLIRQLQAHEIPVFFKQTGTALAKALGLRHQRGGRFAELPTDLRVRDWPRRHAEDLERAHVWLGREAS